MRDWHDLADLLWANGEAGSGRQCYPSRAAADAAARALWWRYCGGAIPSYREIAAEHGGSGAQLRRHVERALAKLRWGCLRPPPYGIPAGLPPAELRARLAPHPDLYAAVFGRDEPLPQG